MSWVAAGTASEVDTTEHTAALPFVATTNQNTPTVISENAPQTVSERRHSDGCRPHTSHVTITAPQVISGNLHIPAPPEKAPSERGFARPAPVYDKYTDTANGRP